MSRAGPECAAPGRVLDRTMAGEGNQLTRAFLLPNKCCTLDVTRGDLQQHLAATRSVINIIISRSNFGAQFIPFFVYISLQA